MMYAVPYLPAVSLPRMKMDRPDDIPEDVWAAVELLPFDIKMSRSDLYGDDIDIDSARQVIARAIMAERERCATVVEMHDHQGVIATAVRNAEVKS